MKVTVKAPGSCGELAQGTIDGENFLITCPINVYSKVTVNAVQDSSQQLGPKVISAMRKTLAYLNLREQDVQLGIRSQLPLGKGMASSSADISATCQSIALAAGRELTPDEIADIALSIEPTDGIFYPGIMLFDHIHGRIRQYLGKALPMHIAVFDVGGEIDTLHFNQRFDLHELNKANEGKMKEAVNFIRQGLANEDISLIGKGATMSALANQTILFKPDLEEIITISLAMGGVGVNIAHSGTVVGVLFPTEHVKYSSACIEEISSRCNTVRYLRTVEFISGGLLKQEGDYNDWTHCSSSWR